MLCPKCGYITFDRLETCPKCRKKCAGVGEAIAGVSSSVDTPCFLGSVIKRSVPSDASLQESQSTPEGPDLDLSGEDIVLDELPGIDFSDSDAGVDKPEEGGIEFDLSMGSEADEVVVVDVDEEPSSLDLNDIDLSDLVTEEKIEDRGEAEIDLGVQAHEVKQDEDVELDLSALEGLAEQSDSELIDLDLDEDLDLSLDLEPDADSENDKKDSPVIPDLGLSLDLDE